jgi:Fe-S cluster assembly protein SufD
MIAGFPTRRDEDWRYADLKKLTRVWPMRTLEDGPIEQRTLANGARETLNINDGRTHVVLTVPDHAHVTLIHTLMGTEGIYARIDIILGAGAKLTHSVRQCAAPACVVLAEIEVRAAAHAQYDASLLATGGDFARTAFDIFMDHPDAEFKLHAVQLAHAEQNIELRSKVHHQKPEGTSAQIIRTVLAEHATGTYLGKISVAEGAQKNNAEQSAKALVLARTATANIKPELEIYADDVKCAHGATVGEMDAQALFYMASRGISPGDARTLLTQAFLEDALGDIADAEISALFHADVETWLMAHFGKAKS